MAMLVITRWYVVIPWVFEAQKKTRARARLPVGLPWPDSDCQFCRLGRWAEEKGVP